MKRGVPWLVFALLLGACGTSGAERTTRAWGQKINAANDQDYNRKAEARLIRSKEIRSGSECVGYNLDGICHGTVIRNE